MVRHVPLQHKELPTSEGLKDKFVFKIISVEFLFFNIFVIEAVLYIIPLNIITLPYINYHL